MAKEWSNIHKEFGERWGEYLKEKWTNNKFDYYQTETWVRVLGLSPRDDYNFAWWLVNEKNKNLRDLKREDIEKLRKDLKELERKWKDGINKDFTSDKIIDWIKKGLDYQEVQEWIGRGLTIEESDFIVYLKKDKRLEPSTITNLEKLRKEHYDAQKWLDKEYPKETRDDVEKLNILNNKNLEGSLNLEGFINLKEFDCSSNRLTRLDFSDCSQLEIVRCQKNNLTSLEFTNCPNITELYCNRNQLTNLDFLKHLSSEKVEVLSIANNNFADNDLNVFSRFVNLKNLGLGNWDEEKTKQGIYNRFSGSLEPLQGMANLEELDINDTYIDSGWEYLPKSINIFYCSNENMLTIEAQVSIAEELKKYGEPSKDKDGDENFAPLIKAWREFVDSPAQKWLDERYLKKERSELTYLDISKNTIKGALRLELFTNLKTLNCCKSQLINLNLSDCPNLIELDCSNNELRDLYFLKNLSKLEHLSLRNNPELSPQSLKFLTSLTELKELNMSDCPLEGSLKVFVNLSKLEGLAISNTNINEGLEYLPESCKRLVCNNSDYQHKSIKIIKELERHLAGKEDDGHYDLAKWRKNKQNSIALNVPLERLYVVRGNIMKFLNKWGAKGGKKSELSNLESPEQFGKYQYWIIPQWGSRAATVAGGVLTLAGQPVIGGIMSSAFPFVDVVVSQTKEHFYDNKEKKWEGFCEDLEELLNNYHELLGILETIAVGEKGEVNEAIRGLDNVTQAFLVEYDKDENKMIDANELKEKKEELARDLDKGEESQLKKIVEAIHDLKREVIGYYKRNEKETGEIENQLEAQLTKAEEKNNGKNDKIIISQTSSQKIKQDLQDWWTDFKTKMNTPIQCWYCLECCGQKQKDKGKNKAVILEEKTSEQKGESSLQAQIEIPPNNN